VTKAERRAINETHRAFVQKKEAELAPDVLAEGTRVMIRQLSIHEAYEEAEVLKQTVNAQGRPAYKVRMVTGPYAGCVYNQSRSALTRKPIATPEALA